jgi:type IV pilus assembly protein PilC
MGARSRLAQAYYDLATLLDAGVPILRSLDILTQGRRGTLKHAFTRIRDSLSKGSSFSDAVDEQRKVFPEMDRMLIQAAETSGSLGDSFRMLSQWHEFVHRITWRVLTGMAYPIFCLHVAAFVFAGPQLILGEIGLGTYLAQALRVLMLLYVPAAVVIGILHFGPRAGLLRWLLDCLTLKIPIFGQAMYHLCVSRYARSFCMLYQAGVPMTECTQRAQRTTGNRVVADLFAGSTLSVRQGGTASDGLSPRLPAEYRDLWRIGEETGELDKTAAKVAEIAADRADLFFREFARWLPIVVWAAIAAVMVYMIFKTASRIPSFSGDFGDLR